MFILVNFFGRNITLNNAAEKAVRRHVSPRPNHNIWLN
jgi:hypothetical protein